MITGPGKAYFLRVIFVLSVFLQPQAVRALPAQVDTPFTDANPLAAPTERQGFTFAILGDRTGGADSGLAILEQAVAELNHLDPDLVMTVGDLVDGYNQPGEWVAQVDRYKKVMSCLKMPWYPTAGNHDVYGPGRRGEGRGNEALFLEHLGPLYYSFDHKNAHFVVLYSDEHLSYRNPPVDQQMSDEQLSWLRSDLAKTRARHTFVFLHHPRWCYEGEVWEPVHKVLAGSKKVSAVIAGHWHRYRSDGERDGIRYYCMATTGASQDQGLETAGFFHHFNLVSVRDDSWNMAVVPVGGVLDPDFITGSESDDVRALNEKGFLNRISAFPAPVDAPSQAEVDLLLTNPTSRELTISYHWLGLPDTGWEIRPDAGSIALVAGGEQALAFTIRGTPSDEDEALPAIRLEVEAFYPLAGGREQAVSATRSLLYEVPEMPVALTRDLEGVQENRVLFLDGVDDCVIIDAGEALNMEGPFTLECWAKLESPGERAALLAKTQGSGYGLWLADGDQRGPSFMVNFEKQGYAKVDAVEAD
ncbi:MAG: metallophosphoesterase, partial [Planctomycetota bacterium]